MHRSAHICILSGLQAIASDRIKRSVLSVFVILCLVSCGSNDRRSTFDGTGFVKAETVITDDVALLGVVRKTGSDIRVNPALLNLRMEGLFADRNNLIATPVSMTRSVIGKAPHDEMMGFYARHGQFRPYQVQRLMAAGLPARYVLAARLESDSVDRLPVQRRNIMDGSGRVFADREQRTYTTRRTTVLSAMLLDMRNGRVVWTRQYRTSPESVAVSNYFVGESFSASVAAAVTDSIVNGINNADYPPAPSLQDSIQVLLQEVVFKAPI